MLDAASKELQDRSPPPINSMLNKKGRKVAVKGREAKQNMEVANVPPTTPCICNSEFLVMLKLELSDYTWL